MSSRKLRNSTGRRIVDNHATNPKAPMTRSICIHGHFYQPPRENPWLEEVELQESAYPYHDWNQRICAECYAPNTAARILDSEKNIVSILNNYSRISFNFGPTLLSWMQRHEPGVYRAIIDADRLSANYFSGHGSALAQCYNHMIMPLAHPADKKTQVVWGVRDFERRFGRRPEGMWLPETAVDTETLEILAGEGIRFTILSPRQARSVRPVGAEQWQDVEGARVDTRRNYLCRLPSGAQIQIFFYDGPVAQDIAFAGLLQNGENLALRLMGVFREEEGVQLAHTATDGETYGHHHRLGDMALAYCLDRITHQEGVRLTVYGEFIEQHPAAWEVEIFEHSSWSCIHGVERWKNDCGCCSGANPQWRQNWRAPLRLALDDLRDRLRILYDQQTTPLVRDPWACRDDYIAVILDRSAENIERFFERHQKRPLEKDEKIVLLKWLEVQRHAMLMYTSCGWFFDEVSGIETVQILQYAARAVQLAGELTGEDLEPPFLKLLRAAPSNVPEYGHAAEVYERCVRPAILDSVRVAAHYACDSLFTVPEAFQQSYGYAVDVRDFESLKSNKQRIAFGRMRLLSTITTQVEDLHFAAVHLGGHNLIVGVGRENHERAFSSLRQEIRDAFRRNDLTLLIRAMEQQFPGRIFSLQHLIKDEQRRILYHVLDAALREVQTSLRQISEHHYPIIQVVKQLHLPLPKILDDTVQVMFNHDLLQVLADEPLDFPRLDQLINEIREWELTIDRVTLTFFLQKKVNDWMELCAREPRETRRLTELHHLLRTLLPLGLELDLWQTQNIYLDLARGVYPLRMKEAEKGDESARQWCAEFSQLSAYIQVRLP